MKRRITVLFICAFALLCLCGCVVNTPVKNAVKIAYISDPAGMGTSSKELVVSAMDEIGEHYDFQRKVYEVGDLSDIDSAVNKAVTEGADLYIGTSYAVNHDLLSALRNSDSLLAMIGSEIETENPNVVSITFRMEEAAFLAGYLAADTTKTGVVAYIGAYDSEDTEEYFGFYAGVKYQNPDISVVSTYTDSYNNSAKGRKAAEDAKAKGADVYFVNCGSCALGISELVRGSEVRLILSEQYHVDAPEVIANSRQYVKNAALYVVDEFLNGQLIPGDYRYGISYGFVDLQPTAEMDEQVKNRLSDVRTMVRTSKIKVPATEEDTKMFLSGNITLTKQ